ncbi:MAG: hypothetical protein M3458_03955 [Acidobacteriota bacterium]|nr:hypothetical protein [Acidobacteriota bacterium]
MRPFSGFLPASLLLLLLKPSGENVTRQKFFLVTEATRTTLRQNYFGFDTVADTQLCQNSGAATCFITALARRAMTSG